MVATGHSLGGGLASAAALVGGIPAHTFNSAGLHRDTLFQRDANGDLIENPMGQNLEIYAGSVARFDTPTLITAYWTDYDILSVVQDCTTIPNAVGTRIELDGPNDFDMTANAAALGAAISTGTVWPAVFAGLDFALTMLEEHDHPTILYGLLIEENSFGVIIRDMLGYEEYF